jgi:hypothetical protein
MGAVGVVKRVRDQSAIDGPLSSGLPMRIDRLGPAFVLPLATFEPTRAGDDKDMPCARLAEIESAQKKRKSLRTISARIESYR